MDFKDLLTTGVLDAAWVGNVDPAAKEATVKGQTRVSAYCAHTLGAKQTYWISVSQEDVDKINQKNPWKAGWLLVPKGSLGKNDPRRISASSPLSPLLSAGTPPMRKLSTSWSSSWTRILRSISVAAVVGQWGESSCLAIRG